MMGCMHRAAQAMLDALCWALRNPKHALPTAPPLAQPPAEAMGLLVGRAVEVLWPGAVLGVREVPAGSKNRSSTRGNGLNTPRSKHS